MAEVVIRGTGEPPDSGDHSKSGVGFSTMVALFFCLARPLAQPLRHHLFQEV